MILRRFMKHVTDQNWFAVGLDVIVVIVGIFLGLQVQAYYEDQLERQQENIYLNQLHDEVVAVQIPLVRNLLRYETQNRNMFLLSNYFSGELDQLELTQQHCVAIFESRANTNPSRTLPTLTEIISSGQLPIIQSESLKSLLSRYIIYQNGTDGLYSRLQTDGHRLDHDYPQHIKSGPPTTEIYIVGGDLTRKHRCNFETIKNDPSFINDLISNAAGYRLFYRRLVDQVELLKELEDELDKTLAINHEEQNP